MLLCVESLMGLVIPDSHWQFSNFAMRVLDVQIFTNKVRMVLIKSREPLRTWFSGSEGSKDQIASVVSMAAIFMISAMKAVTARFTT